MEVKNLLILAKAGDKNAKEQLIKLYYPLVVKQTKGVFINAYTFDDLVQTGIESLLKGINKFNIEKDISTFTPYLFQCLKNNFNYLLRKEIKNNKCSSLNVVTTDNMEIIDLIEDNETLEQVVFKTITSQELSNSLKLLDSEELELISFLYLNNDSGKKEYLSRYAKFKNKDYYYCTTLKKRALKKLKTSMILYK